MFQKVALLLTIVSGFAVYRNAVSIIYVNDSSALETSTFKDDSSVSLVPGELPGYTGWSRPASTLAGHFEISQVSATTLEVNTPWVLSLRCTHLRCLSGGAHFYVRAYGPAVITGQVKDNHDGTYEIQLLPLDPGQYTLEVVLIASEAPSLESFPIVPGGPAYEGFLLPGFPMPLGVEKSNGAGQDQLGSRDNRVLCSLKQLIETNSTSAYGKRRWVVVDKVSSRQHQGYNTSDDVSLEGYQSASNSLGVIMNYKPTDCSFLPPHTHGNEKFKNLVGECVASKNTNDRPVHIIFVGDSVSLMQRRQLEESLGLSTSDTIKTTRISTSGGIHKTLGNVTAELDSIAKSTPNERRYILFNTGLHDIAQVCSEKYPHMRAKFFNRTSSEISCSQEYERYLTRLVHYMESYPAELRVFQSTTAGWPRFGNYGFGWPPHQKQYFSMSTNMVAHFNEIAYRVIAASEGIQIMDGYWMTLPRPDNREVNIDNDIGKHLVHPGTEVLSALGRTWWMIIMRTICDKDLDDLYHKIYD